MEQQHGFNTSQGNFHEDIFSSRLADETDDNELLEECLCCGQLTLTEDNKCYSCGWRAE
jgi:hypothetical protein